MQLDDNDAQQWGEPDPNDRKRGSSQEHRDAGTWAESIHKDDKPKISDEDVRRGAKENDKTGGGVDEGGIKKSAQDGPKDFELTGDHRTEYEKGEDKNDAYFIEQGVEIREIRDYAKMAQRLTRAYRQTMETHVTGRAGMSGHAGGGG